MAFIPVEDVAEVAIRGTILAQDIVNTLFFNRDGGWNSGTLEDLLDEVLLWLQDNMFDILSTGYQLVELAARDLTSQAGANATLAGGAGDHGTGTDEIVPNNVAACVTFRTPLVGRSFRGRNYIAGLTVGNVDTATSFTAATAAGLVAAYEALASVEAALSATHVVVSRYFELAPRVAGVATPVTSYTCDTLIDSQRRRLAGRGA